MLAAAVRTAAVVLAAGAAGAPLAAADPCPPKLVVVVYPNESDGAPGTHLVDRAIRAAAAAAPGRVEVRNEYVDASRLGDAGFQAAQAEFLRRKYAGRKVDVVVAGLASGLDFVLARRADLFPGAPVVYVAVEERELRGRALPPDVVGVPVRRDVAGTLDLALRLHPGTRRVAVVAGASDYDRFWEAEARRAFAPYAGRVEFDFLVGLPMPDLLDRVAALPPGSVIYYLHIFRDGAGRSFIPAEALEQVAARATAPVYGHVDTYVGHGVVGGRVFSFAAEGGNAARLALRLLAGERPDALPPSAPDATADLFDGRELRRWGVAEAALPAGAEVRFREASFWAAYRWQIVGAGAVCGVQAVLIAALLAQRVKRRGADARFRRVVETAPIGMLMTDPAGAIVLTNPELDRLFGYARGELLGRPVEVLVPAALRPGHAADRDGFRAAPAARAMGRGRELAGRRKDGAEVPIEVGLSPLRTAGGEFVLASVLDLTARRRAEADLRASREELKSLAGHLLDAQEAERQRIARELHDDLNQSLAQLAVELDLLGGRLPAAEAGAARAIAARVKELSAAVHALSHQLHPAKLEQLGLVAAVRGLCREFAAHHGLEVTFTHHGLPDAVPPATALCLYRIVQEALRNVVRHAGTAHAAVELGGSPAGLRLRVTDDGAGFDPAAGRGGLGLVSMRERLHLVGGRLAIDSRPGGGTRLDATVPPADAPPGGHP
jgi:PAS domain S-box-containing protein